MKALSLTQPWASLVAIGAKCIETRSFRTSYRGLLAIHASKGFPRDARDFSRSIRLGVLFGPNYEYPLGAVIATCLLADCLPMEATVCLAGVFDDHPDLDTEQERLFGDYSPGRWAWVLEDIKPIVPQQARGALGLWEWSPKATDA